MATTMMVVKRFMKAIHEICESKFVGLLSSSGHELLELVKKNRTQSKKKQTMKTGVD